MQLTLNKHGRRGGDLINKAYVYNDEKNEIYLMIPWTERLYRIE